MSGAAETGAQGLWASLTAGTGMSSFGLAPLATGNQVLGTTSALGATASKGPGQWANPTTRTGISGFGLAQPATGNQGFGQATASGATATEKMYGTRPAEPAVWAFVQSGRRRHPGGGTKYSGGEWVECPGESAMW